MELIQTNKFGELHDGRSVIFCKTDAISGEFKRIRKKKYEVILISGNSDKCVDQELIDAMPDNILRWYCQNPASQHERLQAIPLGLENTIENKRKGHGAAWEHAVTKVNILNGLIANGTAIYPNKLLYSNFNEQTNPVHRTPLKQMSTRLSHITWNEPSLGYEAFIKNVLDHEATLCPAGNGLDTHRIYEVLYAGRIAVTLKAASSPIYHDLYEQLPVVILENMEQLEDATELKVLIDGARRKQSDMQLLDFSYWKQTILGNCRPQNETGNDVIRKLLKKFSWRFLSKQYF